MIGFYKIENLINGKVYIGQSIDIKERWNDHKLINSRSSKEALKKQKYPLYLAALKEAKEQLPSLLSFNKKLSPKDNDFELIRTFNEEVELYFRNYLTKQ